MSETRKNPTYPIVGVGAVVFHGPKVLLIRRGNPPKAMEWSLPGGRQELGETVREAVVREVWEETGLEIKVDSLLDTVDFIERDNDTVYYHYTLIDFSADALTDTPQAGSDAKEACFFSLEQALSLPLWSETKRIIKLAAEKRGLI